MANTNEGFCQMLKLYARLITVPLLFVKELRLFYQNNEIQKNYKHRRLQAKIGDSLLPYTFLLEL